MSREQALKFPPLYKSLQKGRELNAKTFMIWLWKSIYQGFVIMVLATTAFDNPFLNLVTITYSALLVIEFLNVISAVSEINNIILGSIL